MKSYCVYIMTGGSGVLYIGVTNDLERRIVEHKKRAVPGFPARYNLTKLVYFEVFQDVRAAIAREKELKGWVRRRKVALIESVNRTWDDLTSKHVQWIALHRDPSLAPNDTPTPQRDPSPRSSG
jgi:putative endonuclease